jgi:phytoene desaturase
MPVNIPRKKVAIIGSGFAGLSAAAYLSAAKLDVDVYEKNEQLGGRARQLATDNGYMFDMGPSWYWMPEVFEKFFLDFGYQPADFYELELLNPAFRIVFSNEEILDVPADFKTLCDLFESIEPGSAAKLVSFLEGAKFKYEVGMEKLVFKPGLSLFEFADTDLLKGIFKLEVFTSFSRHVRKYFKNPKLIALMEFPVLFLGATPEDTPALYSLMNYAALKLGTWYPKGGFKKVIAGMKEIAEKHGATFFTNEPIEHIKVKARRVSELKSLQKTAHYDGVIAAADYHHIEHALLEKTNRNYNETYWDKRVMAPSALIFYLGITKKVDKLLHHTLFFDEELKQHAFEIYTKPQWPAKPLFYVCCPSKTDDTVAPAGHENLFVLMPVAPDLEDNPELREKYFNIIMDRIEKFTGHDIRGSIDYKKSYCVNDFIADYNSYKGNAYGLANTLMQTANLKPSVKNKHIDNLFYAGQLTVPGPGVPPSIISGKVAAQQLLKYLNR